MFSEPDIQVSYHPLFGSPDADVVFRSSEGTYYRLHSFVLRTTSGFFRSMLSLSGSGSSPDLSSDASPIGLEEKDGVLARFFTMISGMEIPQWDTLDEIEDVLHAAEKYDTPGPISIIRSAITSPRFMLDPLRVYAIAARYKWEEVLQHAAEACLAIPIHQQEYIPVLKRIPTDDLLRLIDLRRERRDAFIHAIDNEVQFTSGCSRDKCACGRTTDHHPWYALKLSVYMEMDERPIVRNMNDLDWEVAKKCWSHKCTYCGRLVYNQIATMECIRPCVDGLPLQLRPRI
ncbi:hypothetical protein EV702DRAFT_1074314 [Suillus placidus]|uniref:BTB domain-containing protein n=1 Tax=Suillus placidus TaxID=48579 RepID=A0A9P7A2H7_9AGAM|nr:hypothetical protein EV702DRAFT_1074314 [Suillus placidus]